MALRDYNKTLYKLDEIARQIRHISINGPNSDVPKFTVLRKKALEAFILSRTARTIARERLMPYECSLLEFNQIVHYTVDIAKYWDNCYRRFAGLEQAGF